jgi:putative peptide zinc metalloprotease protein
MSTTRAHAGPLARALPVLFLAITLIAGCSASERSRAEAGSGMTVQVQPTTVLVTAATPGTADVETAAEADAYAYSEVHSGAGGRNQVRVINRADGAFQFKSSVQLNRIPADRVTPANVAYAYASCEGCTSFAIALQINLISRNATYVAPQNVALALNYECTDCYTVARAIQYTLSVDNPTQPPAEVSDLLREMERELKAIGQTKGISVQEAEQRVNAVLAQFRSLGDELIDMRTVETASTTPGATSDPDALPVPDGSPDQGPVETPEPDSTPTDVAFQSTSAVWRLTA